MACRSSLPKITPIKEDESFKGLTADQQRQFEDSPDEGQQSQPGFGEALHAMTDHATLDQKYWSCPGAADFHIRGKHYMKVGWSMPLFKEQSCIWPADVCDRL